MLKTVGLRVLSMLLIGTASAQPQEEPLIHYQDNLRRVLSNIQKEVRPTLSSSEQKVQESIEIYVPKSAGFGAFADINASGKRRITFSAGTAQLLEFIAVALIVEHEWGHTGCFNEYIRYLFDIVAANSVRKSDGKDLRPAYDVFGYAQRNSGYCSGVSKRAYTAAELKTFQGMMDSSISLIYFHELAHHIDGHVSSGTASLEVRREQEAAADLWAVKTGYASRLGIANLALPAFIVLAGMESASLEDEAQSSHPMGLRRARDALSQLKVLLQKDGASEQLRTTVEALELQLSALLPKEQPASVKNADRFCSQLTAIVKAAQGDFRSLRGQPDGLGDYAGKLPLLGTQECYAWRDESRYTCNSSKGLEKSEATRLYEQFYSQVVACLGSEWPGKQFDSGSEKTTRYRRSNGGLVVSVYQKKFRQSWYAGISFGK